MPAAPRALAALAAAAILSACASPGSRSIPPTYDAVRSGAHQTAVVRGKLESLQFVGTISKKRMAAGLYGKIIDGIGGAPNCDVKLYAMTYDTIGVHNEAANASAAFFVPGTGCTGPFALVGYSHGTNPVKEQLITNPKTTSASDTAPDQDPVVVASIYAAHGYATAATDYLGLGLSTYPFHPYLVGDAEASAVIDSLRAARLAAAKLKIPLSKTVFLSGHSQGGQSTVATQKVIEATAAGEFALAASAPSSGPYALTQTFTDSLHKQSQDAPILAAYILPGYHKTYGNVYTDPSQIFKAPYATGIESLLPVQTYAQENRWLYGKKLPLKLSDLLQPSFYDSFYNDPKSGARLDTAYNDLLKGWKPKAPINLCGGKRDPEVEFKNAQLGYAYFKAQGNAVTLTDVDGLIPSYVPITDYHVVVALFCLPITRVLYFDPVATNRS